MSQNHKRNIFAKQHKIKAILTSGPRGIDRTRREAFDTPNESSVAALGASLVTKQARRVPEKTKMVHAGTNKTKSKNGANLTSGPRGIDSLMILWWNSPTDTSVAALGAFFDLSVQNPKP